VRLVMVMGRTGLAGYFEAEQRVIAITDAVYTALGDEVAGFRKPVEDLRGGSLST
jgi:hypothetical protein